MVKEIKERVLSVFKKHYSDKSEEFKRGFICCNILYETAFEKSFSEIEKRKYKINLHQRVKVLERELLKIDVAYKKLEKENGETKDSIKSIKSKIKRVTHSLANHYSHRLISSKKDERKVIEEHFKTNKI